VECAADLGSDAEEAENTHQLVRESGGGGVSVSRSLQATLAYIRALVVGAPAGGLVQIEWQAPLISLSTPGMQPRQVSPKRTPTEPRAGIVCTADPLVFVGEGSALGGELSARMTWIPRWCRRRFLAQGRQCRRTFR
jgi:hypothetical protein